jgi:hypothetical protein
MQHVVRSTPTTTASVRFHVGDFGTVAGKMALGPVFSQYSGFPYQFSFHQLLVLLNNKRKKTRTHLSALVVPLTYFLPAFTFLGA